MEGRENVKKFFKENPDVFNRLTAKVKEAIGLTGVAERTDQGKEPKNIESEV